MSSRSSRPPGVRIPLALVPLAVYVGVTVLAPVANGAARLEGFWEHAGITLAVAGLLTCAWLACTSAARIDILRAPRSRAPLAEAPPMTLHSLEPTLATLHGHFSRELPPVLTIASGDRVRFKTLDVRWGRFEHDDPFAPAEPLPGRDLERDPGHAMCGPVWIEGARACMTLEVRVISLRVGRWGWTSAGGYPSHWNQKLGLDGPPSVSVRWALDADTQTGRDAKGRTVELRPFLGVMGMPPDEPGRHPTTPPRYCGGNIDCKELVAGSTLYLPISVDGALFSTGDGHAVQGDGEVAGPALECPMEAAELEFLLRPELKLVRPRAHTPRGWVTFGFHDSLDEATAVALSDMLDVLDEQLGCGRREALALASLVVDLHVTQIVNGVRGVHAMVAHEALARLVTR